MPVCAVPLTRQIRGAPAIASLAALAIAVELQQLLRHGSSPAFVAECTESSRTLVAALLVQTRHLLTSRPTAVNLQEALTRIELTARTSAGRNPDAALVALDLIDVGISVWNEDKARNKMIGDNGAAWILGKLEREGSIVPGGKICVLTVRGDCCNLATDC